MTVMLIKLLPILFVASPVLGQNASYVLVEEQKFKDVEASPSVTIIGADKIKSRGAVTLGDLLREVAGVTVVRSGSSGQTSGVFIRGAESRHSLVLIDGLEANDASQPSRGFDFSNLGSENIERIEIYRGPQSVRFGSDAMGGVINIITKKGRAGWGGNYLVEAGSYHTRKYSAGVNGAQGAFDYSLAATQTEASGPSAADHAEGNWEPDASERFSFSSRLGWRLNKVWDVALTTRTFSTQNELDYDGGPTGDDLDYQASLRQFLAGLETQGSFWDEKLTSSFSVHYGQLGRYYDNYPDSVRTDDYHEHFTFQTSKFATRQRLTLSEISSLELNASLRNETSKSRSVYNGTTSPQPSHRQSLLGAALIYDLHHPQFLAEVGVRQDEIDPDGSVTSFSLKPGYHLASVGMTFRAGLASGYKTPTLYQRHSAFGNPNLKSETSQAWETSVEHKVTDDIQWSATYFNSQLNNLIDFNSVTNKYSNIKEARTSGTEIEGRLAFLSGWSLRAAYTHLYTEDRATGLKLLRRPQNSASAELQWHRYAWETSLTYSAMSRRDDRTPVSGTRTSLHSYDLVDLRVGYRLAPWIQLRGRIENLLDRRYQETAGYGNSRTAGYLGISGDF